MLDQKYFKVSNEFVDKFSNLSGNAAKLYFLFKKMSSEKNGDEVWPSYSYIQKITGMANATISRCINELIEKGWINEIDKGFNSVNHYHINDTSMSNIELLEKRKVLQKLKSSMSKSDIPVCQELNTGMSNIEVQVCQNLETNNTNITRLINNTNRTILINNNNNNILELKNFTTSNEQVWKNFKKIHNECIRSRTKERIDATDLIHMILRSIKHDEKEFRCFSALDANVDKTWFKIYCLETESEYFRSVTSILIERLSSSTEGLGRDVEIIIKETEKDLKQL